MTAVLMISTVFCFAAEYSCTLNCSSDKAKEGDEVSFSVDVGEGLSGLEAYVYYDADCFEFVSGEEGSVMMTAANTKNPGQIHIASAAMGATKAGTVYSFNLKLIKQGGKVSLKVVDATDDNDKNVAVSLNNTEISFSSSGKADKQETPKSEQEVNEIVNPEKGGQSDSVKNDEAVTDASGKPIEGSTYLTGQGAQEAKTDGEDVEDEEKGEDTKLGITAAVTVGVLSLAVVIVLIIRKKTAGENNASATDEAEKNGDESSEDNSEV